MSADPSSRTEPSIPLSQRAAWASTQAISYLMAQAVQNPQCLSLAAGLVDQGSLPVHLVRDAAGRMLSDPDLGRQALQYGTTLGASGLRSRLRGYFARQEGCSVADLAIDAEQVVATTGSQQLLSLIAEILLDPGDLVLVSSPTYFAYLGTLEGVGATLIPVPADEHGMQIDQVALILSQLQQNGTLSRLKLVYVVSDFENPSGRSLSAERRRSLVSLVKSYSQAQQIFILEDAAYRELRYDGPSLPSLWSFDQDRDTVIYAQTFSKSVSPGLRVGFGVVPRSLIEPISHRKGNEDFGSAHFNQCLIAELLESGQLDAHVAELRGLYRQKRDAMLAAADEFFSPLPGVDWVRPLGGLYVWMSLPASIQTGFQSPLFQRATRQEQVMYVPGEICYGGPLADRPRNQMRLSFGVQSPSGIKEGMRRLSRAVAAELASPH